MKKLGAVLRILSEKFSKLPDAVKFIFCLFCVLVIGFTYYWTFSEFAFSLFYLIPIFTAVWFIGKKSGVVLSIISTLAWLFADLMNWGLYMGAHVPLINEVLRLIVFLAFTEVVWRLRTMLEKEAEFAREDPLTAIANRRGFYELAERELKRAKRSVQPLSIAFMDIDNFKQLNDRFGHRAGDLALIAVARTLTENARDIDIVSRIGGDEFVILLCDTDELGSLILLKRIRERLDKIVRQYGWPVTFSFGLVTFNTLPESINEMLRLSDETMYTAKQAGKNQIKQRVLS